MPDRVLRAMNRAAPNIYEGDLIDMVAAMIPDLRRVARTAHHVAIYIGNGHAAWEAALANVAGPGDTVLVPATGRFGHGWADMAQGLGVETDIVDFGKSTPLDPARVEQALRADTAGRIRAVLVTHVDTSSSVRNDVAGVRAAIDAAGHPALLMVDCIASLACDRFEMDAWGVDVMVAGSQKGLMVPPGLGFVFFSPKAAARRAEMERVSRYWDWTPRANPEQFYQYWGGTAPTHHLFGLREALDMIHQEGLEAVWARHAALARAIWAACAAWGQDGPLALNVADPAHRSHAVTALRIGAPYGSDLRRWVQDKAGVTLGIGLGMAEPGDPAWHGFFRIGHMGHVNAHMVMGALGAIDAGLKALEIPHGVGALEAASGVLAQAAG
ncbi:alanine-glyoxylate transaminase / serine-glyoxylate transaminase / serine-pyruvate transaminase [Lutimaribacter pacificus]|uniref:Alanine-glyoxylate transaminase / serine-glyoxylate transaminase / serine-pyruvate transaminase n=2 Tax=Lutimaribacter pacificus TaxID=391948 RepID=A0A1H0BFV1_9RHOB|nr:alanine-glyoxylate transaminase / serine-glyoxylate transaminase / serine-pyruvate transaminase [Lutimaribacter pacificus]SHJ56606.1 alanine-glyoxylate transaminase / serine-glyoxylate transaminase / serine-pyruvate transaminase [Lutimaribacter pacificus]